MSRIDRTAVSTATRTMQAEALAIIKRLKSAPAARINVNDEAVSNARADTSAGKGAPVPSNAFTKAERTRAMVEREPSIDSRRWLYALIERGATPQDLVARAEERLHRAPTRSNLLTVQALLNEFARDKRAPLKLRALVSQKRVAPFLGKE